eukprot:COSAG05_NODE_2299_length_3258_cov_2.988382_3_plen_66_part_00
MARIWDRYQKIKATCTFSNKCETCYTPVDECAALLAEMKQQVGGYDLYQPSYLSPPRINVRQYSL